MFIAVYNVQVLHLPAEYNLTRSVLILKLPELNE